MKRLCLVWACLFGLWAARSFGLCDGRPHGSRGVGQWRIDFNYTDDLGGPKDLKTFRWNIPLLTYAFDASFMQYFGLEGRDAVKAFTSVNDFFHNNEYSGVSSLELTTHGFRSNYTHLAEHYSEKRAGHRHQEPHTGTHHQPSWSGKSLSLFVWHSLHSPIPPAHKSTSTCACAILIRSLTSPLR